MAVQDVETTRAGSLWNGERFSMLNRVGVYVVKTYKEGVSSIRTTRAERRLTAMTGGIFGLGKRWKTWKELRSPVEEQDLEEEVMKVPSVY